MMKVDHNIVGDTGLRDQKIPPKYSQQFPGAVPASATVLFVHAGTKDTPPQVVLPLLPKLAGVSCEYAAQASCTVQHFQGQRTR